MSTFDDLVQQLDDLTGRIDESDQSITELSDNTDASLTDVQGTLGDHETTLESLNEQAGQLSFPLTPETVDLIKAVYPTGLATLTSGSATITDARVSTGSVIVLTYAKVIGTPGALSYTAAPGSFSIQSRQLASPPGTDNSIVAYVIYN